MSKTGEEAVRYEKNKPGEIGRFSGLAVSL